MSSLLSRLNLLKEIIIIAFVGFHGTPDGWRMVFHEILWIIDSFRGDETVWHLRCEHGGALSGIFHYDIVGGAEIIDLKEVNTSQC
jgi:hypothetical protein